ncbi:RIP metalloprotease RseP [Clostridium sp. KNHs214]|uniref:RIP metalloprotease RseP n=1 Tax=Clostridium sp. KNHs214 TaxID=1540257 RepID=UPI00068AC3D7|nr:RIP metalloprotease RseP [Clostridium sp. KNHs214]
MNIVYLLLALLAFSVLIIGHELGHFCVAKLNNVKVEEFSVGMGPKLLGKKGKETEYSVRAIPFGGYVKMLGEQGEESSDERALNNKTPLQRLSIVVAGPLMNFILAIILFGIIGYASGVKVPVVSKVELNSPAYTAGILEGDKIIAVDEAQVSSWDDFVRAINEKKDSQMQITLLRKNNTLTKKVTPKALPEENRYIVGVYPSIEKTTFVGAISHGFTETFSLTKETFNFLGGLFQKKVPLSGVGGPVSVMRISAKAAEAGILTLLWISAYISVQLAIFNLLPIPALDGGWILISIIEIIIGRKLNEEKIGKITYVGFVLLMSLAVLVTIKDILYPLKL